MNVYRLLFPAILFMFIFSAVAQQAPSKSEESVLWKGDTRPDIEQTMKIISDWRAQEKSPSQIDQLLNQAIPAGGTGVISGLLFQSDGQTPLPTATQVLVYDAYGFFEGSTYINAGDTLYMVGNLAAGMHYVQAYSYGNYLNEFYPDRENWPDATLVQTFNDSTARGINFNLELGKVITGKVLMANTLDPLAGEYAYFYLYDEDAVHERHYGKSFYNIIEQNGSYSFGGIRPGNYKLKVFNEQFAPAFYMNQSELGMADIIEVPAETDSVKFINFLLNPAVGVQDGYEKNNIYSDAYELSIGEILTPQINPAGDIDYYTFTANMGDTLEISLQAQSLESLLYPYLILYDSSATNLLSSWVSSDISLPNLIIPYSGRYYLRVNDQNIQQGGEEFYYKLSVNYHTPISATTAFISGYVYEKDESTPYSGPGYYIEISSKDGMYYNNIYAVDSVYVLAGIPAGTYLVSIFAPEQGYLNEWYDNAATFFEAKEITVVDQDSISGIDFVLDPGGGISGRIFLENYLNDFTNGGYMYLYGDESPYYNPGFYISPDEEGFFVLSGIRPGQYTMRFDPNFFDISYPSVWFGDVGSRGLASPLTISAGDTTDTTTLIVKRGGIVQGFIKMDDADMSPVSSDSLRVTINLYDEAGFYVGASNQNILRKTYAAQLDDTIVRSGQTFNTFNGGYRTSLLYPGSYKLQVLPQISTLSSWYYSSGSHFDDAGSQLIEIKSDSVHEVPVTLSAASGGISGIVYRPDGSSPSTRPGMVYAYDASGHMVQSTQIGLDPQSGQLLDSGHYKISGLIDGSYYLMLSFNSNQNDIRALKESLPSKATTNNIAPIIRIRSLNYKQNWYPDIIVENPFAGQLLFLPVPQGAAAVIVSGSSVTEGINFTHMINSVSTEEKTIVADNFEISAIYPNPFNPVTKIKYNVPVKGRVRIDIFNILGQKVSTVLDDINNPGSYLVQWNGKNSYEQDVSSGIYIAVMRANGVQSSRKMLLIR